MNEESQHDGTTIIAKKSEKLVTALYLVTDLMSEGEPIKHGIRKNAVALLSAMNSLAQLDVKDRIIELKTSLRSVTEITSLLHVSVTTGIVSEMNGRLLIDGFRSLQAVLEKRQPIFSKEMFNVDGEDTLEGNRDFSSAVSTTSYDALTPLSLARLHSGSSELRRTQESLRQAHLLAKIESKAVRKATAVSPEGSKDLSNSTGNKTEPTNESNKLSTHDVLIEHATRPVSLLTSSFQMRKQSRRDQILALFVKGVDVSIKDIAIRIKGCSEKTIQRELNSLLYDNLIERIGEKRWSRYVIR